ncbi:hypothetical protein A9995_03780 [Erythrobacter sp. QSSC1-22B]|uniref:nucleotidyltransferase family protein n=1 Tax=Erythrobacter sp. QSSC1-22B TaxID=1860125 RepID=UPI00080600BD|nr:nucleotidyltransferase family protein [Erythrobacter sp. QSSC1-22B]OBX20810.1 hypothetical protein A9995_03780 [Erythrobacter sp. QSSC1-22B]
MTACADPLDPSIAVALLAAGRGERFTGDKLAAELDQRPLWEFAAQAALRAGFLTRFVVASEHSACLFSGAPWQTVVNARASEGLASSIRCAAQVAKNCSRLVLLLADMPFVEAGHLRRLAQGDGAVFTLYPDGRRGNPAGFPAAMFARLGGLRGDRGAGGQGWSDGADALSPLSPDSLFDIDTAADLALAKARLPVER